MSDNDVSLERLWATFTGYQRTAALKTAVELDASPGLTRG